MSQATYQQLLNTGPDAGSTSQPQPDTSAQSWSTGPATQLTARERQLLRAVAGGRTVAAVAAELGLATNTVAQHLVSVRRKFRVSSTAAAIELAQTHRLL